MVILGLNAYHGDSSAAIVIDGKLVTAIEEERIRRVKHWAGMPSEAVKWCLSYAGIDIKDVDYIAISRNPLARMHKKIWRVLTRMQDSGFLKGRLANLNRITSIKRNLSVGLARSLTDIRARVVGVEHHRAHLASAFFVSPFEEAACVSIDGFGDFLSTLTAFGRGDKIRCIGMVEFPHSLGIFYTAMTQFLGFWNYGDEYKVMGLSAFGSPIYLEQMRKIMRLKNNGFFELDTSFFLHDNGGVKMTWCNEKPEISRVFSDKLTELLGTPREKNQELSQRFRDVASSVQAAYEEAFFHILNYLYLKVNSQKLVLAGGCIQNSLANGKIYEKTPFKDVYIPAAAYDAGGAIGAAFYLWHHVLGHPRGFVMDSAFWGPRFAGDEIREELGNRGLNYQQLEEDALLKRVSDDIASGKVIGWFQGRTEWGPRALGNRSILADPRRKEMKDILNLRIKKREDFRPFAPSVLEEKTKEWFEVEYPVPFMEKVYKVREEKRSIIPAVTNVDGTGRLQTVSRRTNPRYYGLIKTFEKTTGVPLILNTSFNDNEPIVNTPGDALDCFAKTRIDSLVLENFYIMRTSL